MPGMYPNKSSEETKEEASLTETNLVAFLGHTYVTGTT